MTGALCALVTNKPMAPILGAGPLAQEQQAAQLLTIFAEWGQSKPIKSPQEGRTWCCLCLQACLLTPLGCNHLLVPVQIPWLLRRQGRKAHFSGQRIFDKNG